MDLERLSERIFELEGGHKAFDFDTFEIHSAFQPVYAINRNSGMLYGVEALARPLYRGTPIEPLDFFARLPAHDRFLADWACLCLHLSNAAAWQLGNTALFVNLNPASCRFTDQMIKGLEAYAGMVRERGLSPSNVVFEITEQDAQDTRALHIITTKLHELGFQLAIDDFGTGKSDLMRVVSLKPDIVKVDAGWFRKMMDGETTRQFAHQIILKLHAIGVHLLFEGVETPRELHWARECAGSLIQGWLFGKAVPMEAATGAARVEMPEAQTQSAEKQWA